MLVVIVVVVVVNVVVVVVVVIEIVEVLINNCSRSSISRSTNINRIRNKNVSSIISI